MPDMLVRLKRGKKNFEVIVQEGSVPKYRAGSLSQSDVLVSPVIFTNSSQGTKASTEQLSAAFNTTDESVVIDTILQKGDAQQSAQERKQLLDAKRQQVVNAIQKGYLTSDGKPIPVPRIENALTTVKARIDPDQDAEKQAEALVPKLSAVMPMKRAKADMEAIISVPIAICGAAAAVIRKHAKVQRETYGSVAKFEVEVFTFDLLVKELTKATNADFNITVVGADNDSQAAAPAAGSTDDASDSKGKKKKKKNKK